MLIVALSLFGAWELVVRVRRASTPAARAALVVRMLIPALLGGSFGFTYSVARDPRFEFLALVGLGIVLFALCVVGAVPLGETTRRLFGPGPFEAAGATLFFFAVSAWIGSVLPTPSFLN